MKILYSEKLFSTGITVILATVTLILAGMLAVQLISGPVGTKPAPNWMLMLIALIFLALTLNFSRYSLVLTIDGVRAGYGIFSISRSWNEIRACEIDGEQKFYGWGIRFGVYKKKWVWVYNVIGGPRVVFLPGIKGKRGLIVSTRNPDEVIRISSGKITK